MSLSQQNQAYSNNQQHLEDDFSDDFAFDLNDVDDELKPIRDNAMMLGDFIESFHAELYADHRLSEVIELFATMTSVAKKFGDPFENENVIIDTLLQNYTPEETAEFIEIMQSFQSLGREFGLTALDGSEFALHKISDELIEDLFAEAEEIAREEDEEFDGEEDLANAAA